MLPKERKISSRTRITHIIKKGRRERFRLFSVSMLPNTSSRNRFSVAVSTKVSKKAVERNLIRRQLYEAIRLSSLPQNEKPCYDVVVFALSVIRSASYSEITKEVDSLLNKILWIRKNS